MLKKNRSKSTYYWLSKNWKINNM